MTLIDWERIITLGALLLFCFSVYHLLHLLLEKRLIKKRVLKPFAQTTLDDIRQLRDQEFLYWAGYRYRQLERKRGLHLSLKDALNELNDL